MIVNDLGFDCFIFWGGDNTLHGTSLRTPGQWRYRLVCGTFANKSSSWILFYILDVCSNTFKFLKLFGWRMIVNDLGFDCFISWGGYLA